MLRDKLISAALDIVEGTPSSETTVAYEVSSNVALPTLANAQAQVKERLNNRPVFAEELDPNLTNIVAGTSPAQSKIRSLSTQTPQKRAEIGAKFGGGLGLAVSGPVGAVIGAGVGAVAARGLGLVQSGEMEDSKRRERLFGAFTNLGLLKKDGTTQFDDGSFVRMLPNSDQRLQNFSSKASGKIDRAPYEIDVSNPFSRRSTTVARPLAYFIADGLLKYGDTKNPRDRAAVDSATGMLVNMLQEGVKDEETLYARAKSVAEKIGVTENGMRSFFNSIKNKLDDEEALEIRRGLDTLYA